MRWIALLLGAGCLLAGCGEVPTRPSEPAGPSAGSGTPTPSEALPDLCPPSSIGPLVPGKDAVPDMWLRCLGSDRARHLPSVVDRPTVINFWASWCGPCKVELPLLAQAHEAAGDQVAFVGIDVQDASAEAWKVLTEAGVTYPQLEDPKGRTRAPFGWQSGLPITIFVDASGRMVATERTSFRTYAEVTAAIRRHLGVLRQAQEPGKPAQEQDGREDR